MNNKKDNVQINYYSERGLVNKMMNWFCETDDITKKKNFMNLFKQGMGYNSNCVITFYNEFSFGDWGNPDLIIDVCGENGNKVVLIIEAKVDKFENCCSCVKDSNNNYVFKDESKKNYASKINIQLLLRKRFVDLLIANGVTKDKNGKEIIRDNSNEIYRGKENGRALMKPYLVETWKDFFKDKKIIYTAIVLDDDLEQGQDKRYEKYKKYITDKTYNITSDEFSIVSWTEINDSSIMNGELTPILASIEKDKIDHKS